MQQLKEYMHSKCCDWQMSPGCSVTIMHGTVPITLTVTQLTWEANKGYNCLLRVSFSFPNWKRCPVPFSVCYMKVGRD